MAEVKKRPLTFELNDLALDKISPKSEPQKTDEGVDNFKKWFKDMKK